MKKKKAIILLSLISVAMVITAFLSFVSFSLPDINLFGKNLGLYDYVCAVENIKLGIDLKSGSYIVMNAKTEDGEEISLKDMDKSVSIIRERLDKKDYTEALVYKQGTSQIRIEVPGFDSPQDVLSLVGRTAKFEIKNGSEVIITGKNIKSTSYGYNQQSGGYAVGLKFDNEGKDAFAKATSSLAGSGGKLDICVDGEVVSSPTVSSAITNGEVTVDGFTAEKARDMAFLLESGSLPWEFTQSEVKPISSKLGQDVLNRCLIAGAIGIALIFVIMIVLYKGLGIAADLALTVYILIFMVLLSVVPWVQLTLSGVIGIILCIGIAVGGNVIVYERIKDEFATGKTLKAAIKSGFRQSLTAIIDSGVIAILIGVALAVFGGPVQSFAVILIVGVALSMLTSLFVTRFMFNLLLALNGKESFYALKKEEAASV